MPVETHAIHEKVKIAANKPYGCSNKTRDFKRYYAPNRFAGTTGNEPIWWLGRMPIDHEMSKECRYDMSLSDLRCSECKHRGSGELYAAWVKSRS